MIALNWFDHILWFFEKLFCKHEYKWLVNVPGTLCSHYHCFKCGKSKVKAGIVV